MRSHWLQLTLAMLLTACGARQASDGEDGELPTGPGEWSPCVDRDEAENATCAELCAAEGMTCVANACPAEPDFCHPEPCDMATQAVAIVVDEFCVDASVGGFYAAECDAPIQWILNTTARCCCAED